MCPLTFPRAQCYPATFHEKTLETRVLPAKLLECFKLCLLCGWRFGAGVCSTAESPLTLFGRGGAARLTAAALLKFQALQG
jgi:hypothetical protein